MWIETKPNEFAFATMVGFGDGVAVAWFGPHRHLTIVGGAVGELRARVQKAKPVRAFPEEEASGR